MEHLRLYTDGSYYKERPNEVHGGLCNDDASMDSWIHVYSNNKQLTSMWNVGGEIIAAYTAIVATVNFVKEKNKEIMDTYELELVYDYEGIGHWLTGRWQAKKPATQWFVRESKRLLNEVPNLKLALTWVKGHTGKDDLISAGNSNADKVSAYDMRFCKEHSIPICSADEYIKL